MAVTIILDISQTEKNNLTPYMDALADNGYRQIYFSEPETEKVAYIFIHGYQTQLTAEDKTKINEILLECDKNAIVKEITSTRKIPQEMQWYKYTDLLETYLLQSQKDSLIANKIVQTVFRTKQLLTLTEQQNIESYNPFMYRSGYSTGGMYAQKNHLDARPPVAPHKYENMIIAASRFIRDAKHALIPLDNLVNHWRKYFSTALTPPEPVIIERLSEDNISAICIKLLMSEHARFDFDNLYNYYNDVNSFFNEIVRTFGFRGDSERNYEPTTAKSAKLTLKQFSVPAGMYASFSCDVQRALLATGFFDEFILTIEITRTATDLLNEKIQEFLDKYKLETVSPELLEKGLRITAANNKVDDATFLLQNLPVNVNAQDPNPNSRRTALHLAVERRHVKCIELLLSHRARTDIKDASNNTALSLACAEGQAPEVKALFTLPEKTNSRAVGATLNEDGDLSPKMRQLKM